VTVFAVAVRDNAEMIRDCHQLGYIKTDDLVLDPTFGLGRFWSKWQPRFLVGSDIDPERSPCGHPVDFTSMPHGPRSFDVVVFDPPYKLNGTPSRGGPASSDDDYGVGTYSRWQDRHELISAGISECARVARRHLLIKCQDQVSSGQVRWQTFAFAEHASLAGFRLVDMLHNIGHRPQPQGRRQVHAARNYSTLLVLERFRP
jgi:hypothetical protein